MIYFSSKKCGFKLISKAAFAAFAIFVIASERFLSIENLQIEMF